MSIKAKLIGSGAATVLVFAAILVYSISVSNKVVENFEKLYHHPYTVGIAVRDAQIGILSIHRSMKDVAMAQDAATLEGAAGAVRSQDEAVQESLAVIRERYLGDSRDVEAAIRAFDNWRPIRDQVIAFRRAGDADAAAAVTRETGARAVEDLQRRLDVLLEFANSKGVSFFETTDLAAQQSLRWLLLASFFALVLVFGTAYLNVRQVVGPISRVSERIKDIVEGEGDLTQRISVSSNDEMGRLATYVNQLIATTHDVVAEIAESAQQVAAAATEISASNEEMARSMSEQSNQVTQISAAIEEMNASVTEVARESGNAASIASASGDSAEAGGHVVGQTIEGMRGIDAAVTSVSASVEELSRRGQQIGKIIEVINDIADQTNLLALNATIEAAGAGEHGRGFAVVADEVRQLADRTTKATDEIAESIQAIQSETTDAVKKIELSTTQVQHGVDLASGAGRALQEIVSSAQNVAAMIQSIAAAAEEQSAASGEVARSVESIATTIRHATEGMDQAAAAATQLSGKAEQLQCLVSKFKVAQR